MRRVAKLWKGELSLAEAFWLWGVVGILAISFGGQFLITRLILAGFVSGLLFFSYVLIAIGIGYLVLVSVGIWRSAAQYTGLRLWSWASRGMVIAVVLLNAYALTIVAMHSREDTSDPGKTGCNIEDYLKPTAEQPFVG